jgi:O-glycosyl hydrolase
MLASQPYADSWSFMRELNQEDVSIVLGIWGGPSQYTEDGTRLGVLQPAYYDAYAEYVVTLVDFIVRQQNVRVWAITIANEPDGGDGNRIPPEGLAYIAHRIAPELAAYGVKLYGPDTGSAGRAMDYLPLLLDDPVVADAMAFVGFHEYAASPDVATVTEYVHERRPDLPVIVTEYTSFKFGDLDDGQAASDPVGYTLDVIDVVLSHYREGADAALYWDAVDYLQPGHDAITRWGLLRGPAQGFQERRRYYGFLQVLPYLQPGARVLRTGQAGGADLGTMAVQTAGGGIAIMLVNLGAGGVDLSLVMSPSVPPGYATLAATRTDADLSAQYVGHVQLTDGIGRVYLPGRSVTTLTSTGSAPDPTSDE